jgi:hypothetical protein
MHMCLRNGNECPFYSPLKSVVNNKCYCNKFDPCVVVHVFLNFGSMDDKVVGQKLVSFWINGKFGFIGVWNRVTT